MNKIYLFLHLIIGIIIVIASYSVSTPQAWFANFRSAASLLVAYYSLVFNWYYNKDPRVYAFVNRFILFAKQNHTFWDMNLEFLFESRSNEQLTAMIPEIETVLEESKLGRLEVIFRVVNKMECLLHTQEGEVGFLFALQDCMLTVCLDRRLTVPFNASADYQDLLYAVAEKIQFVVKPDQVQCNVLVYFRPGKPNPFYGFFVNRVPVKWLKTFNVVFKVDSHPDCVVEASTDHVAVRSDSLKKLFSGLREVLTFQALPGMKEAK